MKNKPIEHDMTMQFRLGLREFLRYAVAVMCAIITATSAIGVYYVQRQDTLMEHHTDQLNGIDTKLALIIQQRSNDRAQIDSNMTRIDSLTNRETALEVQFATIRRDFR